MTEEDALTNARLARILRYSDFDSENNEPILWTPSSGYRTDDGAELQDEAFAGLTA